MQVVQDGYSAEVKSDNRKYLLIGRLDASARAAKSTISDLLCSGLIDQDDPLHVAQVISPEDFVRKRMSLITSVTRTYQPSAERKSVLHL